MPRVDLTVEFRDLHLLSDAVQTEVDHLTRLALSVAGSDRSNRHNKRYSQLQDKLTRLRKVWVQIENRRNR